jgi:maleate isomerase
MTDTTGYRANIGIVVPSSNTTVQPECEALRPYGVTNHIGRGVNVKATSMSDPKAYLEHVERMRAGIEGAVDQIMTAPIDHLILGVAIETFWGGFDEAERFRERLAAHAGIGVTFGSQALTAALQAYGCKRIAVLTPHQPQGDEIIKTYFTQAGFEVVRLHGLKCDKPIDIARIPESQSMQVIRMLDGPEVDAIVQVGTALPMLRVAAAAELFLGKPVLAINACSYWAALRSLGFHDKIEHVGRILMDF